MRARVVSSAELREKGVLHARAYVEEERYRIYELRLCRECGGSGRIDFDGNGGWATNRCELCDGGYELVCVAAVGSLQAIGLCLATLAEDDREAGLASPPARGVKDDLERRWLCSLWNPKKRR